MFCSGCGKEMPEGAAFCSNCGRSAAARAESAANPSIEAGAPPGYAAPAAAVVQVVPGLAYAGFWLRLVAYIVDSLIICVGLAVVLVILVLSTGLAAFFQNFPNNPSPDFFFQGMMFVDILLFVTGWLSALWIYYAWMESSRFQATVGKMALGLIVTDMQCRPVSFGRASGRFFAKFITNLIPLWIGYIMAGFTEKKQALHDMIASCLVLRRI